VNGIHQLLVYADANLLCENINTTNKLNNIHEETKRRLNMEVLYIILTVHFHSMFHKRTKCTFFDTILYSYLIPLHMYQSILQTTICVLEHKS
jgi:hypothetical protein